MNGTVTVWPSPVVNWPSPVSSDGNCATQSAFRYTVLTRTSCWPWTTSPSTIMGMSPRVLSDTHRLMMPAAAAPSAVSTGSTAAPYWAAAVWRNSVRMVKSSSGNSRLATSRVVGSTEASARLRSTALAALWLPSSGNPKIRSRAAPESSDAPARLRLKAVPMLMGLETALPVRCRWKPHPAALIPATHSPVGASGSAGSRAGNGADVVAVVSSSSMIGSSVVSGSAAGSGIVVVVGVSASSVVGSSVVSGSGSASGIVVVVAMVSASGSGIVVVVSSSSVVSGSAAGSGIVVVVSSSSAVGSSVVSGSATSSATVVVVSADSVAGSPTATGAGAGSAAGVAVSAEPHAAAMKHSTTRSPSALVTADWTLPRRLRFPEPLFLTRALT